MEMYEYNAIPNTSNCRQESCLGADEKVLAKTDYFQINKSFWKKTLYQYKLSYNIVDWIV